MEGFFLAVQGAVAQGVLWGIMVLGVYITFRVLDFADLTVDGSFALGGAVCATMIMAGVNPFLALVAAILVGVAAGCITGLLNTVFQIPAILAGILTQISLYSINLRIMGRSNMPLLKVSTIFDMVKDGIYHITGIKMASVHVALLIGILCAALVVSLLYWFFGTEIGCAIRATGNNEYMVRALGQNTNTTKIFALMLSNGLIGFSGALVAMYQGFGDVNMGTGAIVIGLASIVIGEVLFKFRSFYGRLTAIVLGAIIYRIIVALVLQTGLTASDLKLITAIIVAIALALPVLNNFSFVKKLKNTFHYIFIRPFKKLFSSKNTDGQGEA